MNKIALSILALAAISTASFAAGGHSWDNRTEPNYGSSIHLRDVQFTGGASGYALAVSEEIGALTNFERLNMNSAKNELASH
jgi:hypothetical protein